MPRQSSRSCAAAVCLVAVFAAPARAQFRPRAATTTSPAESYHVELGAGFWNPAADMQITSGAGGSSVDLKNDLGLQDRKVAEFQLVVKPALKHKIRVQLVPLSYTQTGTPRSTLTFNGQVYPAGTVVNSTLEWKAWRFGYEYDFASTYRGFAGVIVDVKYTDVSATLTAAGRTGAASAQAPIPALGGIARIYLAQNLSLTGELTGFKFPGGWIKSTSGHYADVDLYAMLNFADSFGLRAGYRKFDVEYIRTDDTGTLKLSGPYLGVSARF
jgi:hypothetical protein